MFKLALRPMALAVSILCAMPLIVSAAIVPIHVPGASGTIADSINNGGQIFGDEARIVDSFLYDNAVFSIIHDRDSNTGTAVCSINSSGNTDGQSAFHRNLKTGTDYTTLDVPGIPGCSLSRSINDESAIHRPAFGVNYGGKNIQSLDNGAATAVPEPTFCALLALVFGSGGLAEMGKKRS
jgi:hypothetical protein